MRRYLYVVALVLAVPGPGMVEVAACPFCTQGGKTLTQEVNQATMVLSGKLTNANEDNETTDLVIEEVIKDDALRGKKKTITLSRYVDLSLLTDKDRFLV